VPAAHADGVGLVKAMNILMTAGSRRVALVQGFRNALRSLGLPGRVIVTDINPLSPAVHVADRSYRVPLATEPDYLTELLAICELERVRLLVPTIDDELPILAEARDRFAAAGVQIACSPAPTNEICNDKYLTCRHLQQAGVPAAASYLVGELPANLPLPLFIKPRVARGSVGAFPVRSARELEFFQSYVPNAVIQQYLAGPEFTIDVLCDFEGTPLAIVPRERVVVRAGVIDRGRTVNDPRLIALAEATCRAATFYGPINIQCRMSGDQPTVFEINPRFSGGIQLTIEAGADIPRMLVMLALGRQVEPQVGAFRNDLWMTSFESSFFLEEPQLDLAAVDERPRTRGVA
jgi:carbamoyl-phosphate synthase large subunit